MGQPATGWHGIGHAPECFLDQDWRDHGRRIRAALVDPVVCGVVGIDTVIGVVIGLREVDAALKELDDKFIELGISVNGHLAARVLVVDGDDLAKL